MRYLPLRRSKLVGTEGPGSLVINPEGETAIVGALDMWFRDLYGNPADSKKEFEVSEPRLKAILGVDKFYTPPEFREQKVNAQERIANSNLVTPLLKFPQWHYCSYCKTLKKFDLDSTTSYQYCSKCDSKKYFKQVPFVVICGNGHLTDFPWREWVHGNEDTKCTRDLRIQMSGGTTLDSWQIICESCNKRRDLRGVTSVKNTGEEERSNLGDQLNQGSSKKYKCSGHKPWAGDVYDLEECQAPPVAILRNSINAYMAKKISAIAIPGDHSQEVDWIVSKLNSPSKYLVRLNLERHSNLKDKVSFLKDNLRSELKINTSDKDIETAILYLDSSEKTEFDEEGKEQPEKLLREKEFEKLVGRVDAQTLKIEPEWINGQGVENYYSKYLQKFSKVLRLKETVALYGFDRKDFQGDLNFKSYYPRLYKDYANSREKWLPVNEVYGEGIFLQLNLKKIQEWEENEKLQAYFLEYLNRVDHVDHKNIEVLSPRNIMLHTLSHFLIDEFANTSGYNRASIRERIYMGENQVGVLIYISAGDAEGTLGGLVRLGTEEKFFELLDKSLLKSEWCSSDPVCKELGESQGQGINGLNGAACYNCSHIPETSCELWNTYLDRRLLSDEEFGFFKS
ncbi:DUF1998 domain-containing protein [Planomicrobium okeanokoites]|uniref:DUF1998 domain-containing protein n=1 Tax=Planomicrobium okeanokoites TaxID=244 RepID=UPI0030F58FB2